MSSDQLVHVPSSIENKSNQKKKKRKEKMPMRHKRFHKVLLFKFERQLIFIHLNLSSSKLAKLFSMYIV